VGIVRWGGGRRARGEGRRARGNPEGGQGARGGGQGARWVWENGIARDGQSRSRGGCVRDATAVDGPGLALAARALALYVRGPLPASSQDVAARTSWSRRAYQARGRTRSQEHHTKHPACGRVSLGWLCFLATRVALWARAPCCFLSRFLSDGPTKYPRGRRPTKGRNDAQARRLFGCR